MRRISAQLKKVRNLLIQRRDALRLSLAGDATALSKLKETVGDEMDAAFDTVTGETTSQLAEVESRELAEICNAIDRIDSGDYGKCEACNKVIGALRLQALPYATLCIACARRDERAGPSRGGARFGMSDFSDREIEQDV